VFGRRRYRASNRITRRRESGRLIPERLSDRYEANATEERAILLSLGAAARLPTTPDPVADTAGGAGSGSGIGAGSRAASHVVIAVRPAEACSDVFSCPEGGGDCQTAKAECLQGKENGSEGKQKSSEGKANPGKDRCRAGDTSMCRLTATGRAQADSLAAVLAQHANACIGYTRGLLRAEETAKRLEAQIPGSSAPVFVDEVGSAPDDVWATDGLDSCPGPIVVVLQVAELQAIGIDEDQAKLAGRLFTTLLDDSGKPGDWTVCPYLTGGGSAKAGQCPPAADTAQAGAAPATPSPAAEPPPPTVDVVGAPTAPTLAQ